METDITTVSTRNTTEAMRDGNSSFQDSVDDSYKLDRWVQPTLLCLFSASFLVSFCGNLCIFCVILRLKSKGVTNIFIGSLCLCDILVTLLCIPITVISNLIYYYWPFWAFLCPVVNYLQLASVLQRAFTLVTMTFDQHYAVWRPMRRRMKKRLVKGIIVGIWTAAAAVAVPTAINSEVRYLPYYPGSMGLCTEEFPSPEQQHQYSITLLVLQYVLPVFVMSMSYVHIGYIIWVKKVPGEGDAARDNRLAKSKRKAVTMLLAMVLAYVLCWLPLHVLTLVGDENPDIFNYKVVHFSWLFSHWLATSNSGVYPIIYYNRNAAYRKGIARMFCRCRVQVSRNSMMAASYNSRYDEDVALTSLRKTTVSRKTMLTT